MFLTKCIFLDGPGSPVEVVTSVCCHLRGLLRGIAVATAKLHLVVSVIPTAFGAFGIKRAVFWWFLSFPPATTV